MDRNQKAVLTSMTSILYQLIAVICGFILPRFFLLSYGSAVNGLISSITQFIGFISLAECGVGAVVQSALYKPLVEEDEDQVSKILKSSKLFFNRIGIGLLIYTLLLALVYPYFIDDRFDYVYTVSLVLIISISTFAQYYIGINYRLLLGADQYGFLNQGLSCIVLILNTISCLILIKCNCSIHIVKLISSLIFLAKPLLLQSYAKNKYMINYNIVLDEEPIKQKWNGLSQHFASVVNGNTDAIVLTLLSTLENVSIYSVYHMVVNGVKNIVNAFTAGYIAYFGNMLAKKEINELNTSFSFFEWFIHTLTTIIFTLTFILIIPFINIYTEGISDVNYIRPIFAAVVTIANAVYCLRLPYNIIVMAAGHYKQTQLSAIIEAALNIIISIVFVYAFGLVGVAIGTFIAMFYRTCYLAWYISKKIILRKLKYFIKHWMVNLGSSVVIILATDFIDKQVGNYIEWFCLAVKCGVIALAIGLIINYLFYKKELIACVEKIFRK